jgi:hypothetical protein
MTPDLDNATAPTATGRRRRASHRVLPLVLAAVAVLAAGCGSPPLFSPMPVTGQGLGYGGAVACTTVDGPVTVEVVYGAAEPGRTRVSMVGTVDGATVSFDNQSMSRQPDGRWVWTSPPVPAGVCWSFDIGAVCICCDPCPGPAAMPFTYKIFQGG